MGDGQVARDVLRVLVYFSDMVYTRQNSHLSGVFWTASDNGFCQFLLAEGVIRVDLAGPENTVVTCPPIVPQSWHPGIR